MTPSTIFRYLLCALLLLFAAVTVYAVTVPLPATGQKSHWVQELDGEGDVVWKNYSTGSLGAGQDGKLRKGVAWTGTGPRFIDKGNGTVMDELTGLIWLHNANCTDTVGGIPRPSVNPALPWQDALTWSNALENGACGLTDGSTAGQWRLPNRKELLSLVNREEMLNADWLTNQGFHGLDDVSGTFWSSTTDPAYPYQAWQVGIGSGAVTFQSKSLSDFVWPVRNGISGIAFHLNLTKAGTGTGTVTADSGTIDWTGATGSGHFVKDSTVTFTAVPASGSVFMGWSGACTGTDPCTVTVDADNKSVTAIFGLNGVCGLANGESVVSEPTNFLCEHGAMIEMAPDDTQINGYPLSWNWKCAGSDGGSDATCSAPLKKWYLTTAVTGGGTVHSDAPLINCSANCSSDYYHGTAIEFTTLPSPDYAFTGWTGACSGTGTCTLSMTASRSVGATFTIQVSDVKSTGTLTRYFATIQNALDGADADDSVMLRADREYVESLTMNRPVTLSLKGGYDGTFSTVTGMTGIRGPLVIQTGALVVDSIAIL